VKLKRFSAILEAYGSAPERWPDHERADALALARSSVIAARALAEVRALDDALQAWEIPEFEKDNTRFIHLHHRIVLAARPFVKGWMLRWVGFDLTPSQLWPSAGGLALASVLGFAVGIGGFIQTDVNHDNDDSLVPPINAPASS
jgi:hypothetical protein